MLRSNGCLLVHIEAAQVHLWAAGVPAVDLAGYDMEPLVDPNLITALFALETGTADHWVHAKPLAPALAEPQPWDHAHKAASDVGYEDKVSAPLWRLLLVLGRANIKQDAMYEVEVAQIVASSRNPQLTIHAEFDGSNSAVRMVEAKALLLAEPISQALRSKVTS